MRHGPQSLRSRGTQAALELGNVVRRVVVSATAGGAWKVAGYLVPDLRGGSNSTIEGDDDDPSEVFSGLGVFARPAAGDRTEAIVVNVGAKADHGVIAALRNEDARKRYVKTFGELAPGEVAIANSSGKSQTVIRADGNIEIEADPGKEVSVRSVGGEALAIPTMADFIALVDWCALHVHADPATGWTSSPVIAGTAKADGPPAADGTTVLKAE